MTRTQRLYSLLTEAFSPSHLEVIDESHLHAGHAGARPEGQTHYRLVIQATSLNGLSRIEQHRRLHAAIAAEWSQGLHALAIEIL